MTKEEFEKKINENLKNALNDYTKEVEEIKKIPLEDKIDSYMYGIKLKILSLKLINRIISENNAKIIFLNPKVIRGIAKFDDFVIIEFEIQFNS